MRSEKKGKKKCLLVCFWGVIFASEQSSSWSSRKRCNLCWILSSRQLVFLTSMLFVLCSAMWTQKTWCGRYFILKMFTLKVILGVAVSLEKRSFFPRSFPVSFRSHHLWDSRIKWVVQSLGSLTQRVVLPFGHFCILISKKKKKHEKCYMSAHGKTQIHESWVIPIAFALVKEQTHWSESGTSASLTLFMTISDECTRYALHLTVSFASDSKLFSLSMWLAFNTITSSSLFSHKQNSNIPSDTLTCWLWCFTFKKDWSDWKRSDWWLFTTWHDICTTGVETDRLLIDVGVTTAKYDWELLIPSDQEVQAAIVTQKAHPSNDELLCKDDKRFWLSRFMF